MSSLTAQEHRVDAPPAEPEAGAQPGNERASGAPLAAMVEVDLLPSWYPRTVRRRRHLMWQSWATGGMLVAIAAALALRQENVVASEYELESIERRRSEADARLAQLEAQQARLSGLSAQARLHGQIGLPVEVSRVLALLESAMSPDMALTSFEVRTEARKATLADIARAQREGRTAPSDGATMRFVLRGTVPDANAPLLLFEALKAHPPLDEVQIRDQQGVASPLPSAARGETVPSGSVSFEIVFCIDLLQAAAA